MKKFFLLLIIFIATTTSAYSGPVVPNYKSWERHPLDVPRMTPEMVANLVLSGEEIVFIYAGYKTGKDIVCGSHYLSFGRVPPFEDGSKAVVPDVPKDTLMVVY